MTGARLSLALSLIVTGNCLSTMPCLGGANPRFTLPLHAEGRPAPSHPAPCNWYLPVDCVTSRPVVDLPFGGQRYWNIYLFIYNHNEVTGVNTSFQWDTSWTLLGGKWSCQPGQITLAAPQQPGGNEAGLLATSFDCVTDLDLTVIGRMVFSVGPVGCLTMVNPLGNLVQAIDCDLNVDAINADLPPDIFRLGKICVSAGGFDACDTSVGDEAPVEGSTWGRLKRAYK